MIKLLGWLGWKSKQKRGGSRPELQPMNGRGWLKMTDAQRLGYLQVKNYGAITRRLTLSETRTALDKFFQDPLNHDMPVHWALLIIKFQSEGRKNVERMLADYRKSAAPKQ